MAQVTATRAARLDIPAPIRRSLGRLDRRLRALAAVRGLGTAALVAALGAAAGMAIDFGWGLPDAARWAVWVAWVAAVSVPIAVAAAGGLGRGSRGLGLAAVLERTYPELGERLTGVVGLLGGREPAHGSPGLIAAMADDASARVGGLDPAHAAPAGGALRRLALGLTAAALVAAPGVIRSDPFGGLARRFLMPWAGVDRVGLYTVTVAPGDAVVALGDDLPVTARVAPRFGRAPVRGGAWLEWSEDATGRSRRIAMGEREGEGEGPSGSGARGFSIVLPRLSGPMTYRVVSGSGESRRYRVNAIAAPAVSAVTARVEPPAYTKTAASVARDPARIEAWEGSRVTLTVATSTPVRAAEVAWPRAAAGSKAEPLRVTAGIADGGRSATAAVTAVASGEYTIALRDGYGLASRPETPRRVVVRPDAPPLVAIRGVAGLDESRGDDTLRVGIATRDDIEVASAELHYSIERAATGAATAGDTSDDAGHVAAPLAGLGTRSARGEAALGLKRLGLKPGDVVIYRARVADNRPAPRGPNVTWSGPRRLTIVEKAEPLMTRRDRAGRDEIQAKLDALKKAAAENRHETELLRYAADAVQRGNGEWDRDRRQALGRREAEARAAAEGLEALAADLADSTAFRPLARPARQVAEVEAEAARATLDQARQADDAAKRLADLRQADSRLAAVSNRLEELQRDFNALAEREADRRRLQDLADRQAQLADKADAGRDAPDRVRLDQVTAEQNAVKNDLDELLKHSPDLRADVLAAQADEADALARRARAVAERQRDEARTATDLSKKVGALKALAEEQRAIEDDARRLALDVDAPLAESGRGRLNTEPIRQAVDPIERGDLDQGRQRLAGAEVELRRLARDLEDAPGDLKDVARRLARRQEEISHEVIEALAEARNKENLPADERAALAARLKPLAERQKAVAGLAAAVLETKEAKDGRPEPKFPRDAAAKAAAATAQAAGADAAPESPRKVERDANAARATLQRLANELPDVWKRREPVHRAFNEARRAADEAAREAEQHVREAERPDDRDPARTAAELARRLEPVAAKARKAADRLAAIEPGARLEPQRDRAALRARALADAVDAARAPAPAPGFDAARDRARRDAVSAAAVGSRAANERFEQKLHGHAVPADDVAVELADEQRALAADAGPARADRGDEQRRLATALRGLQAPDAPLEQAEAVRRAEHAARDGGAEAVRRAAEAAGALADRLTERLTPRGRAEVLARAERGLNDPAAPPDPVVEAARQRAVAAELTRLGAVDKADAAAAPVHHAADLAERALHPERAPDRARPAPAQQAAARARAAEALDALAAALPGGQGGEKGKETESRQAVADPDQGLEPGQAARAVELARRERRLKEKLQAVLGERVEPQQDVRREAVEVGRDLADLRDRARALSDRARGPADEASAMLGQHAPRAMDEAADRLAQGQPAPARDAQRRAADLAERGAQNAEDLAAALRADSGASRPPSGAGALGAAREAMSRATGQLGQARGPEPDPAAMNAARQAMHAAADRLQAAAGARAQGPPSAEPGDAGPPLAQSVGEPNADRAGVADPASLAALQELVRTKTGRRWGELPGHLRSEILQMSQGRYRDEYARLIQLYFREIAAGAVTRGDAQP